MTRKEITMLFAAITSVFPNDKGFVAAQMPMVEAWHELLQDIPYQEAARAVAAHAATNCFPPSIADIRRFCLRNDSAESAEQAWAQVLSALKDSAYHSKERFEELPDICKRLVGSPCVLKEWAITEDAASISVARSRFLKQYSVEKRAEEDRRLIPQHIRQALNESIEQNALSDGT